MHTDDHKIEISQRDRSQICSYQRPQPTAVLFQIRARDDAATRIRSVVRNLIESQRLVLYYG